jgi:hypothetical protein
MDLAQAVIDRAKGVVPALCAADGAIARSTKCLLVSATVEGREVVVKALIRDAPVWSHYLRRERQVYEQLRPANVRVPRLVASGATFLVLERVPGAPLARKRHDPAIARIDAATWEVLLAAHASLRAWGPVVTERPDPAVVGVMRKRILEDPSAPVDWVVDGVRRLRALATLDADDAERMVDALSGDPATCFSHGDLLLRNVLRDAAGLALVDWECAGEHLVGWDAGLLWVFAPEWARRRLEDEHAASRRAFLACVAFALTREAFYRRRARGDLVTERLLSDRARVLAELRST